MGITPEDLALVAAFNFFVQLFVDFAAARYADHDAKHHDCKTASDHLH